MQREVRAGRMAQADVTRRIRAWIRHASQAATWRLRGRLLSGTFRRGTAAEVSCSPWRLVQQQQSAQAAVGESQQERTREP